MIAAPACSRVRRAVVIGSGFGGLAAAVRLGARGYRVTVLEQLDAPGGRAYVHRQDGFTFDAGPTIVTAPFLFEELWALCGRRLTDDVELRAVSPYYRIRFDDGETFEYSGDAEAMRAEVRRLSPADVAGYERFMRTSEAIFKVGFEQLAHVPFSSFMDMVKTVPDLVRLQSYRTVYDLVAQHVKDPRLRMAFSFHPLLIGGNPFRAPSIYCLIAYLERRWGVHFAMGGTGRLVEGLVGLIGSLHGEVRCNAEVASIDSSDGVATGVTLASGERIEAGCGGLQRRFGVGISVSHAWRVAPALDESSHRRRPLFDGPVRVVLRNAPSVSGCAASHDPDGTTLSRAARGHLRETRARGRLQSVSAPTHGNGRVARAARLRCVLCAVAGAASRQRHGLERARRIVSGGHCTAAERNRACRGWNRRWSHHAS